MITAALQATLAFNLVCSVNSEATSTNPAFPPYTARRDVTVTLRVDLQQRRWCVEECRETMPIVLMTETEIWFHLGPIGTSTGERYVNWESGAYVDNQYWDDRTFRATGRCEPAPFTGFPQRRF